MPVLRTDLDETQNATADDVELAIRGASRREGSFVATEHESGAYAQGYAESNGVWVVEVPHSGSHKHFARLSENDAFRVLVSILRGAEWRGLAAWEEEREPERLTRLSREEAEAVLRMLDVSDAAFASMAIREGLTADLRSAINEVRTLLRTNERALHDGYLLLLANVIAGATSATDPALIRGPLASVLRKCIAAGQAPG